MHNLRLQKILRDLQADLARTVLVILSISVGVFALSLSFRTQAMFSQNMLTSFAAIAPADITVTVDPFDQQLVASLRTMPQLRAVEGYAHLDVRIWVGNQWRSMILLGIDDFAHMQVDQLAPAGGAWPPPDHTLLIERSYLQVLGTALGAPVLIETQSGRHVSLPVSGLTHDLTAVSARLGSPIVFGYVSRATAEWLGFPPTMNTLQLVVADDRFDPAHVNAVVQAVQRKIERAGYHVQSSVTHIPDTPELYGLIASLLAVLRTLGILSLLLSAFLIINTVNGLLVRQMSQIGVLKAIGATRRDITLMYVGGVMVLALLAMLVAVPLAVVASRWLTQLLAYQFNYDVHDFNVPSSVIALEWSAGLIAPLLAALYPILAGTRVTVRQAIAGPQSDQFGASALDRLFGCIQGGPVAQRYVLRNMLRRKSRLALTLSALAFGGAITMAVLSVRATLLATLDTVTLYWQQDITLIFTEPQRTDQITQMALRIPGVARVESQPARLGVRRRPDGRDADEPTALFGVHPDSGLLQPTIVQGRLADAPGYAGGSG